MPDRSTADTLEAGGERQKAVDGTCLKYLNSELARTWITRGAYVRSAARRTFHFPVTELVLLVVEYSRGSKKCAVYADRRPLRRVNISD